MANFHHASKIAQCFLVDLLVGSDAPLRDRVRATTAVLSVGAICMFFLQEVNDRDKRRAIVLEMATDLIS